VPGEFRSDQPIYTQLVERLTFEILSGALAPGSKLSSVRELAAQTGVNPNTMQRALSELERTGLVYSQRTSGRFITEDETVIDNARAALARQRIQEFLASMQTLGYRLDAVLPLLKEEEKRNGDSHL
jgi:GntR family transcriptional regulator